MAIADKNLTGLNVLVTRPEHQAGELVKILEERGATATLFPLLHIHPILENDPAYNDLKQKVLDLDLFQHLIFVSVNAANLAIEHIDQFWPQLPVNIQWHAIGKQTALTLNNYGIDAYHSPVGYDSEALLNSPALQQISHDKVLIFRGEGGREKLADELRARGAEVSYAELYRRQIPIYSDTEIQATVYNSIPDAILISSGEGLRNFLQLAQGSKQQFSTDSLLNCQIVVPSKRIRDLAVKAGFKRVTIASGPDNLSMTDALMP